MKTYPDSKSYVCSVMSFVVYIVVMSPLAAHAHGPGNEPILKMNKTLTVIDAHHKTVGQIGPFPTMLCGGSAVSYKVGNRVFTVSVNKTGFIRCLADYAFESTDCSGTPFVFINDTSALVEIARVGEPGSTVYLPDLDNIQHNFLSHSFYEGGLGECFSVDNIIPNVAPEIAIIDLDTLFTPPFDVR
jgi:hypothetical protein